MISTFNNFYFLLYLRTTEENQHSLKIICLFFVFLNKTRRKQWRCSVDRRLPCGLPRTGQKSSEMPGWHLDRGRGSAQLLRRVRHSRTARWPCNTRWIQELLLDHLSQDLRRRHVCYAYEFVVLFKSEEKLTPFNKLIT